MWLKTTIPDGQPKSLLQLLPADYPYLNFALVTAGETGCGRVGRQGNQQ